MPVRLVYNDHTSHKARWLLVQGRTPLHHAAYNNDEEKIKVLLRFGADAKAVDHQVSPLS